MNSLLWEERKAPFAHWFWEDTVCEGKNPIKTELCVTSKGGELIPTQPECIGLRPGAEWPPDSGSKVFWDRSPPPERNLEAGCKNAETPNLAVSSPPALCHFLLHWQFPGERLRRRRLGNFAFKWEFVLQVQSSEAGAAASAGCSVLQRTARRPQAAAAAGGKKAQSSSSARRSSSPAASLCCGEALHSAHHHHRAAAGCRTRLPGKCCKICKFLSWRNGRRARELNVND